MKSFITSFARLMLAALAIWAGPIGPTPCAAYQTNGPIYKKGRSPRDIDSMLQNLKQTYYTVNYTAVGATQCVYDGWATQVDIRVWAIAGSTVTWWGSWKADVGHATGTLVNQDWYQWQFQHVADSPTIVGVTLMAGCTVEVTINGFQPPTE